MSNTELEKPADFRVAPETDYPRGIFHDITIAEHRKEAVSRLIDGEPVATEALGPFGYMVALRLMAGDGLSRDEIYRKNMERVKAIGILKGGRDMLEKPPTIMTPIEAVHFITDWSKMTHDGRHTADEVKWMTVSFLGRTGTFAEIALSDKYAGILPIVTNRTLSDGTPVNRAILASPTIYPAMYAMVENLWNKGYVMAISSANPKHVETRTDPGDVYQDVKNLGSDTTNQVLQKNGELLILDNPKLRDQFATWGIKPCSYTILSAVTGFGGDEIYIERQGNIDPSLAQAAMVGINRNIRVLQSPAIRPSSILVDDPFFNTSRVAKCGFPAPEFWEALGYDSQHQLGMSQIETAIRGQLAAKVNQLLSQAPESDWESIAQWYQEQLEFIDVNRQGFAYWPETHW